jgi:restriction system protein
MMAVPDYQTLMFPLLKFAEDGKVHTGLEAVGHVDWLYKLSSEDRALMLPSGRQRVLNNRTHWALTYLRHAGLLESAGHGKFAITDEGRKLLASKPAKIDKAYLVAHYPAVGEFVGASKPKNAGTTPHAEPAETPLNPEEQLEASYLALRSEVELGLLQRLKSGSPEFFEKAVLEVLVAMGYGGSRAEAAVHLGRPGDGGVDGVINEDKLGLDKVCVQAKRWEGTVGMKTVREFVGSLANEHARKGILITTSTFVKEAFNYCSTIDQRLVLIDGADLVRHMVDHGVGVQVKQHFASYRIDEDFFEEAD